MTAEKPTGSGATSDAKGSGGADGRRRQPIVRRRPRKKRDRTSGGADPSAMAGEGGEPCADDSGGYDPSRPLGKGNPPRDGMIRKGERRNADGRRGKNKGRAAEVDPDLMVGALEKALRKKVSVSRDGHRRRLMSMEALCELIIAEGLSGDRDAQRLLTQLLRVRNTTLRHTGPARDVPGPAVSAPQLDEQIATRTISEFLRLHGVTGDAPEPVSGLDVDHADDPPTRDQE